MKNILFILFLMQWWSFSTFSQKFLDGVYYNKYGICLKIKQDTFKLIMPNAARNGWYSEVMAEGVIKQIDNSFIELNTNKIPSIEVLKDVKITQRTEVGSRDSVKIRFLIPYQGGKLKITIFTNTFKRFKLDYFDNNRELKIPNDVKIITFSIEPENIIPHTPEGLFYGILYFNSIEYSIESEANSIEIKIPAMDDSFFEKYYVKGDYARIMNDSIIWKGEVYKKSKK